MDPDRRDSTERASKAIPDRAIRAALGDTKEFEEFKYPSEPGDGESAPIITTDMENHFRQFLKDYLSLDPYDFIVLQQRVVYRRTAREIGKMPLLPGRMSIIAISRRLASLPAFRPFRSILLANFDQEEKENDNDQDPTQKRNLSPRRPPVRSKGVGRRQLHRRT